MITQGGWIALALIVFELLILVYALDSCRYLSEEDLRQLRKLAKEREAK